MPHRISIIGTTGSGKTTLARQVSRKLGIPHIEFDALHWEPNWTEATHDVFRARLEAALQQDEWVSDGNYGKARDITWSRATTVVWLDYPFWLTFWRLFRRTITRLVTREMLWGHSRETWRKQFLTKDSLFLWFLKTYNRRRHEIPVLLQRQEYARLQLVHLRHPTEAEHWLSELASSARL
jgi:adenylate kinase family enzyme